MSGFNGGGGGGGSGTVTHTAGALTLNAGVFGNGGADIKVDPLITTDGSGNLSAVSFTTTGTGAAFTQWTTSAFGVSAAGTVACGAFTGNIFACSDNGGTVTALPFIAGDIGGTQSSPQITAAHFTGDVSFGTTFGSITVANAGATGTTVNLLAKLNASANAVLPATTDTGIPMIGVVQSGAGTAGSAHIAVMGIATCVADNTVTTGDSVGVGTTTAGRCKSIAAAGTSPAAGLTVVGSAITGGAAGASITIWMTPEASFASTFPTLDQVGNPAAAKNFSLGNANVVTLTMGSATTSANGLTITDTATNGSATGALLNLNSSAGSTIKPFVATALGTANGMTLDAAGNLTMIGTGDFRAIAGSVATPSYSFAGATSTGMFVSGTNVEFSSGSSLTGLFSSSIGTVGQAGLVANQCLMLTTANTDIQLCRAGAANPTWGVANATPTAYTHNMAGSSRGGTDTNVKGANATIQAGIGTGNAAGTQLVLNRNLMGATGTTAQSVANAFGVCESKILSNTSATLTTLATIGLASNSAGGASGTITVTCTDGTNFDSDTVSFNVSFVNKAGTITVGTAAVTASTAANNSGSCTVAPTFTAGASLLNINVTPVISTIVPTTVTGYLNISAANGAGAITCQ